MIECIVGLTIIIGTFLAYTHRVPLRDEPKRRDPS